MAMQTVWHRVRQSSFLAFFYRTRAVIVGGAGDLPELTHIPFSLFISRDVIFVENIPLLTAPRLSAVNGRWVYTWC